MQRVSTNNYFTSSKLNLPMNEEVSQTMYYEHEKINLHSKFTENQIIDS